MPDREKVIKGLECHQIDNNHRINRADCPYYVDDDNHIQCVNDLHEDALALLKEQDAEKSVAVIANITVLAMTNNREVGTNDKSELEEYWHKRTEH